MLKRCGFTLFEILIALFVFAILAMLAALCLHSVIKAREHLKVVDKNILQLQIADLFWSRDVTKIKNRSILDANDQRLPAVMSHGTSEVEITTLNAYNPGFVHKRGRLVRVAYILKKNKLLRLTWPTLDRVAGSAQPSEKVILTGVSSLEFQYLSPKNQWVSYWPEQSSSASSGSKKNPLPKAISMHVMIAHMGKFVRVVNLPGATRHVKSQT